MTNIETVRGWVGKRGYKDNPVYRDAMIQMRFEAFTEDDVAFFKAHYLTSKDTFSRNQILQAFVLTCQDRALKAFFLAAFKKERHVDMRLVALRGYAHLASEEEVIPLMAKLSDIIEKIPALTRYPYQEYEMLRSQFGLPYLVERYGYDCFIQASEKLNRQYDDLPDLCKGFFTLDAQGLHISLLPPEESRERLGKLLSQI
ncbi:hypothetical protein [Pseudomonas cerasi]